MMKRRTTFVAVLLLALAGCASQTTSGAPVAEANQLYQMGRFSEAAAEYQALVDAGIEDGTVYYNLGNAHFKNGDLGRAILNYRRGQRLLPRDPDVAANLELARAQTIDRLEVGDGDTLVSLARRVLIEWTTLDEVTAITMGLWVALCTLTVAAILWPGGRRALRYGIGVIAVLCFLGLLSAGIRLAEARGSSPAVVIVPSVEVRSGPGVDYLTEFSLHAGAEIHVIEERDKWVRIALPGGLQGWASSEAVEKL